MKKFSALSINAKLSILITTFGFVIAVAFISLALWSGERYHQEVTQKLHKDLAQYVLEHIPAPLLSANSDAAGSSPESPSGLSVNKKVLKTIAMNTMMINPSVEVFLLDASGEVLGHALPEKSVELTSVDIEPVERLLRIDDVRGGTAYLRDTDVFSSEGPILGQHPSDPSQANIFSVAPVQVGEDIAGYLYIMLASHEASSVAEALRTSYVMRVLLAGVLALFVLFSFTAFVSFKRIALPLSRLSAEAKTYRRTELASSRGADVDLAANHRVSAITRDLDEVAELEVSFELMKRRIQQQFEQLAESDRLRRELVSNVSHDLRTPLASMQGYLETLLLKYPDLNEKTRVHYIGVAHSQSKKLGTLISQLFELSKLDAGRVKPNIEVFSLNELLYDIKQDYELLTESKNIALEVELNTFDSDSVFVQADISLIQRVLQNLLDNAIAHTEEHGEIIIGMSAGLAKNSNQEQEVSVYIKDSGKGIEQKALPFVFERFYQTSSTSSVANSGEGADAGCGLGLNIVKKILDLHGSIIEVQSRPSEGTCFSFALPRLANG